MPVSRSASTPKRPEWMRVRARFDDEYRELKQLVRDLDLHTVCEEAGCPNIYECWADRTATFMILGDRCTRACGFCQVDTRKPLALDADEPRAGRRRGADARARARGHHLRGARRPARRRRGRSSRRRSTRSAPRSPGTRGRGADPRLQGRRRRARRDLRGAARRAEPQPRDGGAPAARGAAVGRLRPVARACWPGPRTPGSSTKSGLILGMGETDDEVRGRDRRPAQRRRRHADDRPVPAAVGAAPAGRASGGHPDEFDGARRVRRVARLRARRVGSARALQLPRPGRRGQNGTVAERFTSIKPDLAQWWREQPLFFVATAPVGRRGPREPVAEGLRHLARSSTTKRVAYLDLTGSGVETISHLRENGRITLMACAFAGNPRISRCTAAAQVHPVGSPGFDAARVELSRAAGTAVDHRDRGRPCDDLVRRGRAAHGARRRP